jgi:hypothetical protein
MAKILKSYLKEGLDSVEQSHRVFSDHAKALKASVNWIKKGSFMVIAMHGYPAVFTVANENLTVVRQDLRHMHDLPQHFFTSEWRKTGDKFAALEKALAKLASQPAKVDSGRDDLQYLTSAWENWGLDYQELVEAYIDAVNALEQQIEDLY